MERRIALKLITAGVLAERLQTARSQLVAIAQAPSAYNCNFSVRSKTNFWIGSPI